MMNLEGKTYIVTGSSMGIGEAIARRIVNLNGKVLIHGLEMTPRKMSLNR